MNNIDPGEGFDLITPDLHEKFKPKLATDEWYCEHTDKWMKQWGIGDGTFNAKYTYRRRKQNAWKKFSHACRPKNGDWFISAGNNSVVVVPKLEQWSHSLNTDWYIERELYWQPFTFTPPQPEKTEVEKFVEDYYQKNGAPQLVTALAVKLINAWEARVK